MTNIGYCDCFAKSTIDSKFHEKCSSGKNVLSSSIVDNIIDGWFLSLSVHSLIAVVSRNKGETFAGKTASAWSPSRLLHQLLLLRARYAEATTVVMH